MEYEAGSYLKLQVKEFPARSIRETAEGKYWKQFKAPVFAKQVSTATQQQLGRLGSSVTGSKGRYQSSEGSLSDVWSAFCAIYRAAEQVWYCSSTRHDNITTHRRAHAASFVLIALTQPLTKPSCVFYVVYLLAVWSCDTCGVL
jgi:hypothetical protein